MENDIIILNKNKVGDVHKLYFDTLNESINNYIEIFSSKHGIAFDGWVGNQKLDVAIFGDHFLSFTDIIHDLENGIDKKHFFNWYYHILEEAQNERPLINYENYLKSNLAK